MDKLRALRLFVSIVESRSYTRTAKQFGLSRPQVSREIGALEQALGVRLVSRTTRQVHPTELGLAYYHKCRKILGDLDEAEFELGVLQGEPRGILQVLAPKSLAVFELADAVCEFTRRHPRLEVRLVVLDQQLNLIEHGFDLALRFGEQDDSSLVCRRLSDVQLVTCASPQYLEAHGTPQCPRELADHQCIRHNTISKSTKWRFEHESKGTFEVDVKGAIATNNTVFLKECLLRDAGIGIVPHYSVRFDLQTGTLKAILEAFSPGSRPLYAVYPTKLQLAQKIRLFIDFLGEWFGARQT